MRLTQFLAVFALSSAVAVAQDAELTLTPAPSSTSTTTLISHKTLTTTVTLYLKHAVHQNLTSVEPTSTTFTILATPTAAPIFNGTYSKSTNATITTLLRAYSTTKLVTASVNPNATISRTSASPSATHHPVAGGAAQTRSVGAALLMAVVGVAALAAS